MNRSSIHLFIFGFLCLLVIFISGTSAQRSKCVPATNCDCNAKNIGGCGSQNPAAGTVCGKSLGCALANDIYQSNGKGEFCHFGPCTKGCNVAKGKCNSGTSAKCVPAANCDCNAKNIGGCGSQNPAAGTVCGKSLGCALANDIYQSNGKGEFCHFGPCTKGCNVAKGKCN